MSAIISSNELLDEGLSAIGTSGPLNGAKLIFFTNPSPNFNRQTPLSDLVQAVVPGVDLPHDITWSNVGNNQGGQAEVLGDNFLVSAQTAPTDPVTITGAAIIDSGGTLVRVIDVFPVPKVITYQFDCFWYTPRRTWG